MISKAILRSRIREQKKALSDAAKAFQSLSLCERIRKLPVYQKARVVLTYFPLPDEVDVRPLLTDDKRFLLPVIQEGDILLKEYLGKDALASGAYSIQEPAQADVFTAYPQIDLVIVPGIAFSPEGGRVGRGKGYYDRFLPKVPEAWKLGVGYAFQLVDSVPLEPHDIRLDQIVVSASGRQ